MSWTMGMKIPPHDSDDSRPRDVAVSCREENCGLQPRVEFLLQQGCTLLKKEFAPQRVLCTEWYQMISLIQQGEIVGGKCQL